MKKLCVIFLTLILLVPSSVKGSLPAVEIINELESQSSYKSTVLEVVYQTGKGYASYTECLESINTQFVDSKSLLA